MRLSLVALLLLCAGCGGGGGVGGPSPFGDLGASSGGDLSTGPDLAARPDLATPPDLTTSPDLAPPLCGGPRDCGGNPCCVKIMNMMFAGAMCTQAMTDCPPDIINKMQTRACTVDADCTRGAPNTQYNLCCTGKMGNQTGHVCANQFIAGVSGGALTCP